jgi:hypothetical protein
MEDREKRKSTHNLDKNIVRDNRDSENNMWSQERNMATGFTFKGLFMLIAIVVIVAFIKELFF